VTSGGRCSGFVLDLILFEILGLCGFADSVGAIEPAAQIDHFAALATKRPVWCVLIATHGDLLVAGWTFVGGHGLLRRERRLEHRARYGRPDCPWSYYVPDAVDADSFFPDALSCLPVSSFLDLPLPAASFSALAAFL